MLLLLLCEVVALYGLAILIYSFAAVVIPAGLPSRVPTVLERRLAPCCAARGRQACGRPVLAMASAGRVWAPSATQAHVRTPILTALLLLAGATQQAASQLVTTLAGGGVGANLPGTSDGNSLADALYNTPRSVAVGSGGIVYVSDTLNHKIRAIYPNQTVITLAGGSTTGNTAGLVNGIGSNALFFLPYGVAVDPSGIVYVADRSNHKIRAIYPNQTVITLAGGSTAGNTLGSINGIGSNALFNWPYGVAVGNLGIVYVAEFGNHKIRAIYPNQTVITLAGGSTGGTTSGLVDGVGSNALFYGPNGIAVDSSGIVYVADRVNHKIRAIYPSRNVITLAGGSTGGNTPGSIDGIGSNALFDEPYSVAVGTLGIVYVAEYGNHKIRAIYPNRTVITLAGGSASGSTSGSVNGIGSSALFSAPHGVAVDTSGVVYVADTGNHKIRIVPQSLQVTTFSGGGDPLGGSLQGLFDGVGTIASFSKPRSTAIGPGGIVYVADTLNHKIRAIYPNQTVTTLAGGSMTGTTPGSVNGIGSNALFSAPTGITVGASGIVYVADTNNHKIRAIFPNQTVIALAGGSTTGNTSGSVNGIGTSALFSSPNGVAVSGSGIVYVTDYNNHKIRAIFHNRTVITIAGGLWTGNTSGSVNGVGFNALFLQPSGVAVDSSGILYVADRGNHKIRAIFPNQTVITLAGGFTTGNTSGSVNGIGSNALFYFPQGVAVDSSGIVYVADAGNHKIRAIYPNQTVITLAGGSLAGNISGSVNGFGSNALFGAPHGVTVDNLGIVYVADFNNHKIRVIHPVTCLPGSYRPGPLTCLQCPPGTFSTAPGSTSCAQCPGGHACPAGTASWARLNCGRGSYCPDGSGAPRPCPFQVPPPGGWGELQAQGPAFLVETASCLNQCFWNFTSGDGMLSRC